MPPSYPRELVVGKPGRACGFTIAIAAEALVTFHSDGRRKLVIERAGNVREQVRVADVDATNHRKNVVVADVERVDEVRAENMVPVRPVRKVIVRLPVTFARDLLRKHVLAVPERPKIMNCRAEMVGIAPVHIALDINHGAVRVDGAANGSGRRIVGRYAREVRLREILEPGARCVVRQP